MKETRVEVKADWSGRSPKWTAMCPYCGVRVVDAPEGSSIITWRCPHYIRLLAFRSLPDQMEFRLSA